MPESLAIEGGVPVRSKKWPLMIPGGLRYGPEEKLAALEVIDAQSPFRYYGINPLRKVDQFEKAYAAYVGTRFCLATHSGSTALSVALAALDVGPGTEVIMPAFMWIADVNAVVNLRAVPVLADIDETLNLDPCTLEKHITPRTRAIIAVHMAGTVADILAIKKIADKYNIAVLEDCSQAAGARIAGRAVGSMGTIAAVSLQYNKNFTTGEGGMITTDDESLYNRALCFHDTGFARDLDGVSTGHGAIFETFGMGVRMDELRGALGLVQLGKLESIVKGMRRHQIRLREALNKTVGIQLRRIIDPEGDSGSYFSWFHETSEIAERFTTAIRAEGIPVGEPHGGIHQYRYMSNLLNKVPITTSGCPWTCPFNAESPMEYRAGLLPRSDDLLDRARLLPLPASLSDDDIDDVIRAFRKVARLVL